MERDLALPFRAALALPDLSLQQGVVAAIETWLTTNEDPDLRGIAPLNCILGAETDIDGRTEVMVTRARLANADEEAAAVTDEVADLLDRIGVDIQRQESVCWRRYRLMRCTRSSTPVVQTFEAYVEEETR